jgi:hypothetical protein
VHFAQLGDETPRRIAEASLSRKPNVHLLPAPAVDSLDIETESRRVLKVLDKLLKGPSEAIPELTGANSGGRKRIGPLQRAYELKISSRGEDMTHEEILLEINANLGDGEKQITKQQLYDKIRNENKQSKQLRAKPPKRVPQSINSSDVEISG